MTTPRPLACSPFFQGMQRPEKNRRFAHLFISWCLTSPITATGCGVGALDVIHFRHAACMPFRWS